MIGARLVRMILSVLESEQLEESPEPKGGTKRVSFISRLLRSEELPLEEPPPQGPGGEPRLRLFASESLPDDTPIVPAVRRASFLAWLFSAEELPSDPAGTGGPGGAGSGR